MLAAFPVAAQAAPAAAATWTQQAPASSPPAEAGAAMAYDAATGTVVMFGGFDAAPQSSTWTWNGSTWTRQNPAAHPPERGAAAMAYDAATGTVVLFGGLGQADAQFGDTWTWNGSTWTKQAPAAHPAARYGAAMAYDAATSTGVLFGGQDYRSKNVFGDTWTWDGTTWTKQAPESSPHPGYEAGMAYDGAAGNTVLFGGLTGQGKYLDGTWTWG